MRFAAVLLIFTLFAGCTQEAGSPPVVQMDVTMADGSPLRPLRTLTVEGAGTTNERIVLDLNGTYDPDGDLDLVYTSFSGQGIITRQCKGEFLPCKENELQFEIEVPTGVRGLQVTVCDREVNCASPDVIALDAVHEYRFDPVQFTGPFNGPEQPECDAEDSDTFATRPFTVDPGARSLHAWIAAGNATFVICSDEGAMPPTSSSEVLLEGDGFPVCYCQRELWFAISHEGSVGSVNSDNDVVIGATAGFFGVDLPLEEP